MKTEEMKKAWIIWEFAKERMLDELEYWDVTKLTEAPEGQWNSLQVLEHVMLSEKGCLEYMLKKTASGHEALDIMGEEQIKNSATLNEKLASDQKWKAPDAMPDPSGDASLSEMIVAWDELHSKYEKFLRQLDEAFYDRLVFRHPYAGPLSLEQTFEFLTEHINHHMHQLKRLKASHEA